MREISVILEGASNRLKREQNANAWLAWHTAALSRITPKKFPKLKDMMSEAGKPSGRQMTPEQIQEVMRGIFASRKQKG
ncbi:hypothetical protein [Nitratireductor basaltis]|uniref:Uncharacterized protein n=1 Tax=Nitratireductor basaltis TaxID=472175 RepID=A0A084UBJ5_9HYPH|nr:hypothetical protein [Nitratireductor basaltis]KFB10331.1 hypothetical protein EL18_01362 [Nitratireductor basaltis]